MKRGIAFLTLLLTCPAFAADKPTPKSPPAMARPASGDSVQDLIFLGDNRPIFLRLEVTLGDRPFRSAWMDSVKTLHAYLDRDGDGTVTKEEADRSALATIVRVANGSATALPRTELDMHPKDGKVSLDELAEALRTALGPFRVEVGKVSGGKTDALFDQLDGDKDGVLIPAEMKDGAGLLKLDLDDDELVDEAELEPFADPTMMGAEDPSTRRARFSAVPPVLEIDREDATLRPVRLLMKRYDRGASDGAVAGDNRLARSEFGIEPARFQKADADADGRLDIEELRRFLAASAPDLVLAVALSADAAGAATVAVRGPSGSGDTLPAKVIVKQLGGGDVEIAVDEVRLEVHVDDGARAAEAALASFVAAFDQADSDNNGYLEKSEMMKDKDHPSSLAGLFDVLDRDADGKVYLKELTGFVEKQTEAARSRLLLTTADQGRAIFAILDLNRDRRLGLRELRGTIDRVSSWDRNGDGKVSSDEIPHHFGLTLGRGSLVGMGNIAGPVVDRPMDGPRAGGVGNGPSWFRRMDRNRDGDLSSREFLGSKAQFEALDADGDGLIDATEASAATTAARKDVKK